MNLVFIKIGGSCITDKNKPYTAKLKRIQTLSRNIASVIKKFPSTRFILGNGAGSFGHYPVVQYDLIKGIQKPKQVFGYAVVQDGVSRLNRLIVRNLLFYGVPAVSLHSSSICTTNKGKIAHFFIHSFLGFLNMGVTPVLYGDIVYDKNKGSHIISTEDIFLLFIEKREALTDRYNISKVIYIGDTAGVLDNKGNIIKTLCEKDSRMIQGHLYTTDGYDVTGGMAHKVASAMDTARLGISSYIIGGQKEVLINILEGKEFTGTLIT